MSSMKNWLFRTGAGLLLASAPCVDAQTLNGAGSTFPNPIYRKWFSDYRKLDPAVKVNYQATGSGTGIQKITDGSVDFGATDDPMTDAQLRAAKDKRGGVDILHFPTVMGAIVPIYNVPGVTGDLNFTPAALAGIYLGKITKWNDPEIARANPGVSLRDDPIKVVYRQDASGATFLWTEFLSSVSPEWKAGPGQGLTVKWPVGLSVKGDEGVVHLVENTWDAIGFVEYSYAFLEKLPHGKVRNSAGVFVAASPASVAAAAGNLSSIPSDMRASFVNPPGREAYPIASLTWLLVPSKLADAGKQKAMSSLLRWVLTEGQKSAAALGYAPLPSTVVQRELERIGRLGQ
jgi:phosphate transport system substrate-binding protein